MTASEVAGGSLAIAHGALHLRIKLFGTPPWRWYLGPFHTYFLHTTAGAAICLLLAVLLVPHGGGETEEEGDSEWVQLLKVHHLLYINKLFFYKVDTEPFYTSTLLNTFYKMNDHKGWLHILLPHCSYILDTLPGHRATIHYS